MQMFAVPAVNNQPANVANLPGLAHYCRADIYR